MLSPRTAACVLVLILRVAVGYAAPGDPVGAEFQVNTYTTGYQGTARARQSVAQVGAGFVVVWQSGAGAEHGVQAQRFDGAGQPIGAEFQVTTYSTEDLGGASASVAPTASGGFVIVWRTSDSEADPMSQSVQARRYDADGAPVGAPFQVNAFTTADQREPVVARLGSAGGFVVAWLSYASAETDASNTSIQAGLFDPTGTRVSEFQVNTYTTGRQGHPSILALEDGGFAVVWDSDGSDGSDTDQDCVRLRRFDPAGTPQGSEFQVNAYTTSYQSNPVIGSDGLGGFVVTWHGGGSGGTDTSFESVQARRFDGGANPLGAEFQVNSYTTGYQYDGSVTPDGAGGFVLVWGADNGNATDDSSGIYARRFDAFGAPASDEFHVNTYTTGDQDFASVAPDGAGGFVVVWRGAGGGTDTDGSGVHAQRFAGGPTTTSTSSTSTTTTLPPSGEPLAGKKLQLATKAGHPEKAKLALVSGGGVTLGDGNGGADDPVVHGGALTIGSDAGGFSTTIPLAGAWKYVGKAGQGKGYKWKSRTAPIRSVVIKNAKLAIAGRGAGLGFDLDDDPNPVRIGLAIGAHAYCLEFGGAAAKFKAGKLYRAKGAPAPAGCP